MSVIRRTAHARRSLLALLVGEERAAELRRIYSGDAQREEVRHTAVGWKPDDTYTEGRGIGGQVEYYKIVRKRK